MTMRTIVLANSKAGTGKSTLAASLAVAAAAAGEKVIALDLDPQGSLANWGETRAAWCAADDLVVDHVDGARLTQLPQILAALDRRGFTSRFSIPQGSTALAATSRCVPPHSVWYRHGRRGLIWRQRCRPSRHCCALSSRTGSRSCSTNVRPDAARARPKPPRDWARSASWPSRRSPLHQLSLRADRIERLQQHRRNSFSGGIEGRPIGE